MVLLLSLIEFMFLFNAQLSLNYATRDAALVAAEAGNNANADCLILQKIDQDLNAPTDETQVQTIHIYSATENGAQLGRPVEMIYTRGGTTSCGSLVVSYTLSATQTYPANIRCSDLDRTGCSPTTTGPSNTGVDIIGVRIDYGYHFITPLGSTVALIGNGQSLWNGTGMVMSTGNAMRMEPIL